MPNDENSPADWINYRIRSLSSQPETTPSAPFSGTTDASLTIEEASYLYELASELSRSSQQSTLLQYSEDPSSHDFVLQIGNELRRIPRSEALTFQHVTRLLYHVRSLIALRETSARMVDQLRSISSAASRTAASNALLSRLNQEAQSSSPWTSLGTIAPPTPSYANVGNGLANSAAQFQMAQQYTSQLQESTLRRMWEAAFPSTRSSRTASSTSSSSSSEEE